MAAMPHFFGGVKWSYIFGSNAKYFLLPRWLLSFAAMHYFHFSVFGVSFYMGKQQCSL
jgi:hypothetical protein